jgi:hypothetical protein
MMYYNPNVAMFYTELMGVQIGLIALVDHANHQAECFLYLTGKADATYKHVLNVGDSIALFSTNNAELDQITLLSDGTLDVPERLKKYEVVK